MGIYMKNQRKEKKIKAVSYSELSKIIGGDRINADLGDSMDSSSGLGSGASNTESSKVTIQKNSPAPAPVKK